MTKKNRVEQWFTQDQVDDILDGLVELGAGVPNYYRLYLQALGTYTKLMDCTIKTRKVDDKLYRRYARATEAAVRRLQRRLQKSREWEAMSSEDRRKAIERDIEKRRLRPGRASSGKDEAAGNKGKGSRGKKAPAGRRKTKR